MNSKSFERVPLKALKHLVESLEHPNKAPLPKVSKESSKAGATSKTRSISKTE